jgi:hypothetical protein
MSQIRINRTSSVQLPLWVNTATTLHFRWRRRRNCPVQYRKKEIVTLEDGFDRVLAFIRRHPDRHTYVMDVNGRAKCMSEGSRKIKYYQTNHKAVLIGIYNGNVQEEWLLEDLKSAGMKG